MAGMASGDVAGDQAAFFDRHIAPWAAQFFDDLAIAPSARFYRPLAEIGRLFVDIEARAFALSG
jgi:TorA maturation chaperone TorD